jgi:phosphoribosyl-ATP pyrophosphohydrolase
MSVFTDVLAFLQLGHPDKIRTSPGVPTAEVKKLCWELVREEYEDELEPALNKDDLPEIADAIADCIWVLVCLAYAYGLPIEEIWAEVRRANMDKFPGGLVLRRPSDGKIMKPLGWQPPDIQAVLRAARLCVHCGKKFSDSAHLPLGGACVFRAIDT